MQVKRILFGAIVGLCAIEVNAGSSPAKKSEVKAEEVKAAGELKTVDIEVEALLDQAKQVREERDRLEEQSEELQDKDPVESKRLEKESEVKHEELVKLLYKLEELLKQKDFLQAELGDPSSEEDSPYQP